MIFPGITAFMVMLYLANSIATVRMNPSIPAFVAP